MLHPARPRQAEARHFEAMEDRLDKALITKAYSDAGVVDIISNIVSCQHATMITNDQVCYMNNTTTDRKG